MTNIWVRKSNPINIMQLPRNKLKSYLHSAPTVPGDLGPAFNKIPRKYYRLQSKQPHDLMKQGSKYPIHQQLKLKSHKHQGQKQLSSHVPPLGSDNNKRKNIFSSKRCWRWWWYEVQAKSAKGLHIGPMTRRNANKYIANVKCEVHVGVPGEHYDNVRTCHFPC